VSSQWQSDTAACVCTSIRLYRFFVIRPIGDINIAAAAGGDTVSDASQAPLLEGRPAPQAQTNQVPNVCISSCIHVIIIHFQDRTA